MCSKGDVLPNICISDLQRVFAFKRHRIFALVHRNSFHFNYAILMRSIEPPTKAIRDTWSRFICSHSFNCFIDLAGSIYRITPSREVKQPLMERLNCLNRIHKLCASVCMINVCLLYVLYMLYVWGTLPLSPYSGCALCPLWLSSGAFNCAKSSRPLENATPLTNWSLHMVIN